MLQVRTHTISDTSGISVCFGNVQDNLLLENAKMAVREMGAKWSDHIQIDTTHFVCTTPAATPTGAEATGGLAGAPGVEYQKALQMSIPVVQPTWVLACHSEKRMVPIHPYYLGATPSAPINSATFARPQSMSQATLPSPASHVTSPTGRVNNRQSMPPPARAAATPPSQQPVIRPIEPMEEEEDVASSESETEAEAAGRTRKGTMSKNFKFPPSQEATPPLPEIPPTVSAPRHAPSDTEEVSLTPVIAPSVEMPPPPPVDKERSPITADIGDDEVGDTEEISLN